MLEMELKESLNRMKDIRNKADFIFDSENLNQLGFGKSLIFANLLKQHNILFIGLNPGGEMSDEIPKCEEEIRLFFDNPLQNDFLDEKYKDVKIISQIRKFYLYSFGKSEFENKLKQTFWWNLCLSKNGTDFGKL